MYRVVWTANIILLLVIALPTRHILKQPIRKRWQNCSDFTDLLQVMFQPDSQKAL